jgi:hypothetical protein
MKLYWSGKAALANRHTALAAVNRSNKNGLRRSVWCRCVGRKVDGMRILLPGIRVTHRGIIFLEEMGEAAR